jgi:hypothetical protein
MDIYAEIDRRAESFLEDNFTPRSKTEEVTLRIKIRSAMLIGASVVLEQGPDPIPGEDDATLRQLFGTPKYDGCRGMFDFRGRMVHSHVGG